MSRLALILWPSFLAGGVAEVLFFTAFDPADLDMGRLAAYSAGFFFFWALAAGSSALTCFLQRTPADINRQGSDP